MAKRNRSTHHGSMGIRGMIVAVLMLAMGGLAVPTAVQAEKATAKKPIERAFPSSEKCKRCHLRVYEEWEASAQSRSIVTAPFRVTLEKFLANAKEQDRGMCFQCHAPHILEYGELLPMFIKEVQSKDPHMDGVGCPQCHLIQDVDPATHPPTPSFSIGKKVFGGYDKAAHNLAHKSEKLKLYRESQYCVTCHDSLPKTAAMSKPHTSWLGPWKKSKAESEGKTCQSCHMPEGFDESANGEKIRKIANHSFPGRFGKVRAKAVEVEFSTTVKGTKSQVDVKITSLVPHNLPLPHPGWSRVVVDLSILGKNLKRVYHEQRFYQRVFGTADGKDTVFDFEATKVLKDTLLKPEEVRKETFTFPTPKDAPSMDVIVTLTYAPVHGPKAFLSEVEQEASLGKKARAFQTVKIWQKKTNVSLKK